MALDRAAARHFCSANDGRLSRPPDPHIGTGILERVRVEPNSSRLLGWDRHPWIHCVLACRQPSDQEGRPDPYPSVRTGARRYWCGSADMADPRGGCGGELPYRARLWTVRSSWQRATFDLPRRRVRALVQGSDEKLYIATDEGNIWAVEPGIKKLQ